MLRKAIDSMLILLRFDERKDYYNSIPQNWLWNSTFVDSSFPINTTTTTTTTNTTTTNNISSTNSNMNCDNLITTFNNIDHLTTPLLTDSKEFLYRKNDYNNNNTTYNNNSSKNNNNKITRAKSISNRNSMIHYSNVNYNKRSKRNNNNHNHKCNEKRTKRRNQFNHIRLHSYDENIQNYYHEDGEFSTDVTYLPLSELNHSLDPLKVSKKTTVYTTTTNTFNTTTTTTYNHNSNTQTSKLTVDEGIKKDNFNSPSLPIVLHPPSQIVQRNLEAPSSSSCSSTSPSSSSSSGSTKQINNPDLIINNHSNLIFKNVNKNKQNQMDNFHLLINDHNINNRNQQVTQNYPFQGQQEVTLATQNNNNNHNNNIFKECMTDCLKLNHSQQGSYRTPVISDNTDPLLINNPIATTTTTTTTTPITTTTTTTTPIATTFTNDITIHSLIHNHLSSNIHLNTSRSNSGQTLIDHNNLKQNHNPSKSYRVRKLPRKRRSNSLIDQHLIQSFPSCNSCFHRASSASASSSSLNNWSKYQKHWLFTFYNFDDEHNIKEDDTALVHSVFAVVAARLRQKHNGSKSIIKKVSEYEKLSQDHDDNHKNNHENKSKSNQTNKQIHQHIRLASYISNDIPKQSKSKEINNKDEQQLWRLCIKWNPKDLSNKSTLNPTNTYDNNNNISNENTHQFKLKKTHIFATLGTEIDKTSVYSDHSTVSLISLDIHGIDRLEKKRQSFQHYKYYQKRLIQQYINDTKQKSIICSVCQRLINVNSNEQALSVLYDNRKMNNMGQMNMNNDLISEQIRTDQISFDKRYKGKCKLNQNSNSQSHEIHDYPSYCLTKCNNIQYKRNSCHILTNHNINWEKFKHDYNTTTTNNTTYNNPIQYRDYYYYPRKIPDNIDHDQFNYGSKLWINSLDQTISTSMLHCQQCLYNKLNKGCNKQGYLNGSCNNNNNSNELSKVHIKSNCIHGNSNSVMYCCNQCKQWFIPLWNQLYYSRNKRHISKDDNLIHRSYNHHCYHRSSSQPLTKHERIIQNHLSKNNRYNYNNSDTIQCSTVQHRIPINQQSYKRQSKHRHRRTKRRAKSHLPIQRFISNDTNNQVNDTSIQFNHYKLESYRSQKEIDCQPVVNNSDKFIVDPFLDPYEHLINLKQDHKLKHHNRKYLGQLNVQEWLDKTITSNY